MTRRAAVLGVGSARPRRQVMNAELAETVDTSDEWIAERTGIDTENDRRICKQLADSITEVAEREGKDGWSFAAPASIHSAVVELLPPAVRNKIVEYVKSDLVKIEPAKLPGHFRSLQPV